MKLSMTVSTAGFWLILLITLPFLRLWVGQQYYAGAFFLVCASFLYLIHHTYMHVTAVCLNAAGIVKGFSLMSLIESALNIVISLWLCNRYGIIGVIYGTLISGTITSCWYVPFVAIKRKHFTLSSYLRSILQPVLLCSVFGLLAYVAFHNSFERIDNWFKLIFYTGFVSLIFLIPSFLINRSVILNIKQRLYAK
jgi:O-antigen/teichoic acid export membrane protein